MLSGVATAVADCEVVVAPEAESCDAEGVALPSVEVGVGVVVEAVDVTEVSEGVVSLAETSSAGEVGLEVMTEELSLQPIGGLSVVVAKQHDPQTREEWKFMQYGRYRG